MTDIDTCIASGEFELVKKGNWINYHCSACRFTSRVGYIGVRNAMRAFADHFTFNHTGDKSE